MSRLVIVSNRVSRTKAAAAGGLGVAMGQVLKETGGLWFGWSGKVHEAASHQVLMQRRGRISLAMLHLTGSDHDSYYAGYSNNVLWPVFHHRLDLAHFDADYFDGYRRVNQLFAKALFPLLREDDIVWVHDYHLIPLAAQLRALGARQRLGFFLHIPFPPQVTFAAIPQHLWLARALFAYDLIGMQTQQDVHHFARYVTHEALGQAGEDQVLHAFGTEVACRAFPIGIDVKEFVALAQGKAARETWEMLQCEYAQRRLLLGIDRLDYSKGLPQRIRAFRQLLAQYPENHRLATLIQIGSPTRESVDAYADLRKELESLCGALNGDYGELDWMPVRYIHQVVARNRIPGLCKAAAVGLVTPLRDGMNLVAKEFVAAQDPENPGVLVLSRFAGAAEQLTAALLINPYDVHGTAEAMQQALCMPLDERRARHQQLLACIERQDVHWWRQSFVAALLEKPR